MKHKTYSMKILMSVFLLALFTFTSIAQNNFGAQAGNRNLFENGDVVVFVAVDMYSSKSEKSTKPYQEEISAVYYAATNDPGNTPFVRKGIAYVKFSNLNGIAKKGDYITSSEIPGTAMKATETGMVLGVALEDFKEETGLLKILVEPVRLNLPK